MLDEVNVKIEGLDLDVRKKLSDTFKFEVPGARYMPAVRLGRWDGKVGFFQLGGSTYINLLADILPILEQYNYDVDLEDYRDYQRSYDLEPVNEDSYSDYIWPPGHPQEGQQIKLRDYQVEVINKFLDECLCSRPKK